MKSFLSLIKEGKVLLDDIKLFAEKKEFDLLKSQISKSNKISNVYWSPIFDKERVEYIDQLCNENEKGSSITEFLNKNENNSDQPQKKCKFDREGEEAMKLAIEKIYQSPSNEKQTPHLINLFFCWVSFAIDIINDVNCSIIIYIKITLLIIQILLLMRNFTKAVDHIENLARFINDQLQNKVIILYLREEKSYLESVKTKIEKLLQVSRETRGFEGFDDRMIYDTMWYFKDETANS